MTNMKNFIIIIILIVVSYYALKIVAANQTMKSMQACSRELQVKRPPGTKLFSNEAEAKEYSSELVDCIDKRNGFIASLFFSKDESMKSISFKKN